MAVGKASDFQIYEEQFYGGMWEGLSRIVGGFNEASSNTIRLVQNELIGNYEQESFFKSISSLVTRRDTTSVSDASDLAMTQDEFISVKVNRKIGPIAQTLDAWRKVGKDQAEMSFLAGQMIAEEKAKDLIDTSLIAVETALQGQSDVVFDATGESTKTLTHQHLNSGIAKLGDFGPRVRMLVMHSKPYYDLIGQSITDNIFEVGGAVIREGIPQTFGRPTLVIDSPSLTDANGSLTDTYNILGLVEDAVVATESEDQEVVSEVVTGKENLIFRIQGEYAFNLRVRGFKWDTGNGQSNPTDTTLGTTDNWDLAVSNIKNGPGIRIVTQ